MDKPLPARQGPVRAGRQPAITREKADHVQPVPLSGSVLLRRGDQTDPAAWPCHIDPSGSGVLEQIADREAMPVARFVSVLHDEIMRQRGEVGNFASFLRVTCLHWLRHVDLHAAQVAARIGAAAEKHFVLA